MEPAAAAPAAGLAGARVSHFDMLSLPVEVVPLVLDCLDRRGLGMLRRTAQLGELTHQAHVAELRAAVLELLELTVFPFTHAAYVLGLNGLYYSYDTIAENHYGIPKELPPLLCEFFRLAAPSVPFTTLRVQKLDAAANFGGKHRTLAFSLGEPMLDGGQKQPERPSAQTEGSERGHLLCVGAGCKGGRCELREDLSKGDWQLLAAPSTAPADAATWRPFPRSAWLQWHWPTMGAFYAITATCEPPAHRGQLTRRERRRMVATGFLLPDAADGAGSGAESGDDGDACAGSETRAAGAGSGAASPTRRSQAAVAAAARLLGLELGVPASACEVEEAFRRTVRAVHPDRGGGEHGGLAARTQGWAMAQLTWARRVLRDAASLADDEGSTTDAAVAQEAQAPRELPPQDDLPALAGPLALAPGPVGGR